MPQSTNLKTELQVNNAELFPDIVSLLKDGHTVTIPLRGWSMRPFLEDRRDKALLKIIDSYSVGMPVLAEITPGRWVLHRIVEINGENVILRGDGNLNTEECQLSDIKAVAVGFYRKGRNRLDSIENKKWRYYSFIWCKLLPVRRWLLAFYRRWVKVFGPI